METKKQSKFGIIFATALPDIITFLKLALFS